MFNPVILALKVERLATETPIVDPTFVKSRKVPVVYPPTLVRIFKVIVCTFFLLDLDSSEYNMFYYNLRRL